MVHPSSMKDPVEIEDFARKEAQRLNISNSTHCFKCGEKLIYARLAEKFVIGHFYGVIKDLQREINNLQEKISGGEQ